MNSENSKLRHEQQARQEHAVAQQTSQSQGQEQEFSSVEDLLRYDNEQNPVPEDVAHRLNAAIAAEPKSKSWLKSLFGS